MYVPTSPITARVLSKNAVIKVEDEYVLVVNVEDHPANRRVSSPGTTTITYSDIDAITSRRDTAIVDRHQPIMLHTWRS